MAIINDFNVNNVLKPAHNNIIGTFYSSTLTNPDRAIVTINTHVFKYSPDNAGKFTINITEIVKALINTNLFADSNANYSLPLDVVLEENTVIPVVIQINIEQGVSSDSSTVVLSCYNGVAQTTDDDILGINDGGFDALHTKTVNGYQFIYNEGFPFDIGLYNYKTLYEPSNTIELYNITTGNYINLNIANDTFDWRLVFCDGATDITIEDLMPLVLGVNKFKLTINDSASKYVYFNVEKRQECCGTYIKWMNEYGKWNYWLFNKENVFTEKIKSIGNISADNLPVEKTISSYPSLGSNGEASFKASSGIITPEYYPYFYSLFKSPKVYLYTGSRFAQKTNTQWQEIVIIGDYNTNKLKGLNYEFDMEFAYNNINTAHI